MVSGIVPRVKQLTKALSPDMVRRLRSNTPVTANAIKEMMIGIVSLAREFSGRAPNLVGPALETNPSRSFVFRFAPAGYLLAVSWIASGGIESATRSRLANDVVDMNYVALATFFDGVLSQDNRVNEVYRAARWFLDTAFVDLREQPVSLKLTRFFRHFLRHATAFFGQFLRYLARWSPRSS